MAGRGLLGAAGSIGRSLGDPRGSFIAIPNPGHSAPPPRMSTQRRRNVIVIVICAIVLVILVTPPKAGWSESLTSQGLGESWSSSSWSQARGGGNSLPKKLEVKGWDGPASIPSAVLEGETFPEFLQKRLGAPDPGRPIWLTEADARYLKSAVPHLRNFLARLEAGTLPPATSKVHSTGEWADQVQTVLKPGMAGTGKQDIVVICLDDECVKLCEEERLLCYGGYIHEKERPQSIKTFVWAKMRGECTLLA